jgi:tRNA uridine 5-carboxymethylaminomethyl modification enzyme
MTYRDSLEAEWDVLVIGGGHAGVEAAVAAARLGARVGLVTSALETIGQMSCNPAIGGVAKGTVVREVDALGGVMGRATDRATVQFRMLNRGKGPAVWSPRAQCDRGLYRRAVRSELERHERVALVQGTVSALVLGEDGARVVGVETLEGRRFGARATVVTTGTFLRGRLHIGTDRAIGGGRAGDAPATHLAEQLEAVGLTVGRFKTGTPPRIDGRSVDFSGLAEQGSELADFGYRWSHFTDRAADRCGAAAPLLDDVPGGRGEGRDRRAPGRERDVRRGDRRARAAVLPVGRGQDPPLPRRGAAPALPRARGAGDARAVRERAVDVAPDAGAAPGAAHGAGLEHARMTRAGYAIEYDYYPPTQLDATLRVRALEGLWFAGQINGTTGYEEAAAQGTVAGLNAALWVQERPPLVLGRETSYVAVLADDLVTRGVDEPYRLFTSRSEFRLTVRQDNALRRLSPVAESLGLYTDAERPVVARRLEDEERAAALAERVSVRPEQAAPVLAAAGPVAGALPAHAVRAAELARRPGVSLAALFAATTEDAAAFDPEAVVSAELELKYAGYLARERDAAARLTRMGGFALPEELPYAAFRSITTEARQKLAALRPASLAQAGRVPGVSPNDLQNLVVEVERWRRARVGGAAVEDRTT